jgi:hypothetical protein
MKNRLRKSLKFIIQVKREGFSWRSLAKKFIPLDDLMRQSPCIHSTSKENQYVAWFVSLDQSHETIFLTILQVEKEGVRQQEPRAAAAPLQVAENPRLPAIEAGQPSFLYIHSFILLFTYEYGYLREVYIGGKATNYWGATSKSTVILFSNWLAQRNNILKIRQPTAQVVV